MEMNWLGLASAVATFLGVWIGHVSVRKIERQVERIWIPATLALLFGLGLEIASFRTSSLILSTICGILGVTLLWDALELASSWRIGSRNGLGKGMRLPTRTTGVMPGSWRRIRTLRPWTGWIAIRAELRTRVQS
jgi:hypothetical protein